MTMSTEVSTDQLPAAIITYLAAHEARDHDTALTAFDPGAVVRDDGQTFRGTDEILGFLRDAAAEFTYTTEIVGAQRLDAGRWVVTCRVEGDFPGGVVVLDHNFALDGDLIAELVIAP